MSIKMEDDYILDDDDYEETIERYVDYADGEYWY